MLLIGDPGVREGDRCCVICLILLSASYVHSTYVAMSTAFECSYEVCFVQRRDGRMSVGCSVDCKYSSEVVFSGGCSEGFELISTWFGRVNRHLKFRDVQILEIGIAYYFSGYILRPLSSVSNIVTGSGKIQLGGTARCTDVSGSVEIRSMDFGTYKLEVSGQRNVSPTWVSVGNKPQDRRDEIINFLKQNLSLDEQLFHACPQLIHAVEVGHRSDISPAVLERTAIVRRDACSGGFVVTDWSACWTNWTKYCEIREQFQRDPGFRIKFHRYEAPNRLSKMAGMFVVVFGAFALLALFCGMSVKQRRSLFKDIKGESSLRLKGEDEIAGD